MSSASNKSPSRDSSSYVPCKEYVRGLCDESFSYLHPRAHQVCRSFHKYRTPREYLEGGITPDSLCKWLNLRTTSTLWKHDFSGFMEVWLFPPLSHLSTISIHHFLGGFKFGDTSLNPGNILVNRSLALGEPVIFVSANYRLNGMHVFDTKRHRLIYIPAFGFLAGKEVKDRGLTNVGLHDRTSLDPPALLVDWRI